MSWLGRAGLSVIVTAIISGCAGVQDESGSLSTGPSEDNSCALLAPVAEGAPAILMSQIGVPARGPKRAILRTASTVPVEWTLSDQTGDVVATGVTEAFGANEASGDVVHRIDFSDVDAMGDGFTLKACGETSRPFTIGNDLYETLAEDALRYFYHNRIGIETKEPYLHGPEWVRPVSLNPVVATCFYGEDMRGQEWPGCDYSLDVTGSWFDAGDFGVYGVNMGVSIWTIQNAYERLELNGGADAAGWGDGRIPLPENANGVSPLLDEARVGMESLIKLQAPEGARAWVAAGAQRPSRGEELVLSQIDVSGMVHHKLAGRKWAGFPNWPHEDNPERFLFPPSTSATLSLAATGAQCYRLWKGTDDVFADKCLAAARRAYDAAKANPDVLAYGNFDGSGPYGDFNLEDEFAWAAAELFLATNEARYYDDFRQGAAEGEPSPWFSRDANEISWPNVTLYPAIGFIRAENVRPEDKAAAKAQILRAADAVLAIRDGDGYMVPMAPGDYGWGSNGGISNRGVILGSAYDLTGKAAYRDAAVDAVDYLLGRNVIDQSYVAGYGARPMVAPHHRFWSQAADPSYPPPPPGALSGGANITAMVDPVAQEMRGTCAPMACYKDHSDAYALNEVAINWNSAFVWLTVFLDTSERALTE